MMLVFSFFELGDLHDVLFNKRWHEYPDLHWASDGALARLALGIVSGMRFLHEFHDEQGFAVPVLHR